MLSEAARGPHLSENAVPALALSSLAAAFVIVGLQWVRALVATPLHTLSRRPAS